MKRTRIAFWSYDLFPYVLHGKLIRLTRKGFDVEGYGHGGLFDRRFLLGVLPEAEAADVIASLERLKTNRGAALRGFDIDRNTLLAAHGLRLEPKSAL